jgi:hypothetical protein
MRENGSLQISISKQVGGLGDTPFDAIIAIDKVVQLCTQSADAS